MTTGAWEGSTGSYRFAKVVDQVASGQHIYRRQVVNAGRVVMVSVNGEDRQAHAVTVILEVCLPVATSAEPV